MLVFTRKTNEVIMIQNPDDPAHPIEITVVEVSQGEVKLGIIAPRNIEVNRREVYDLKQKEMAG